MTLKCIAASLVALLTLGGCNDGSGSSKDEDKDEVPDGDEPSDPVMPGGFAMRSADCALVDADAVVSGGDELHAFVQYENGGDGSGYTQRDGYMVGNGSGWTCYTLPDGMRPERARLFADGSFAALWIDANGFNFAIGTPMSFSLTKLATPSGGSRVTWDAAIDDQGVAHVAFIDHDMGPTVYYAELSAIEASVETLIEPDSYFNPALFLQVDAVNKVHVISANSDEGHHYTTGTKGAFVTTPFAGTNFDPFYADLVRDASGALVLLSFVPNGYSNDLKAIGADDGFSGEATTLLADVNLYRGFSAQQDTSGTWYVMADASLHIATSPTVEAWRVAREVPITSEIGAFAIGTSGIAHVMGYRQGAGASGEIVYVAMSEDSEVTNTLSPVVNTYYSTPIVLAK